MAPSFVQAAVSVLFAGSAWASVFDVDFNLGVDEELLVKRDVPTVLPGTWQYQGCYTDQAPRTLGGPNFANTTGMTPKLCIDFCDARNYIFAGVEYSQECCEWL